jgi:naringenin degradation protein FdeH
MRIRRRIVTGHDAEGRAVIVQDGPSPGRLVSGELEELWAFSELPARLADVTDPAAAREHFQLVPPAGQVVCRLFTVSPVDAADRDAADAEWDARVDCTETETGNADLGGPWMHRTPTIDLIVVIAGAMELVLDSGATVPLQPGDSVVQRGTMHGWRNTGSEPCLVLAVMTRAE